MPRFWSFPSLYFAEFRAKFARISPECREHFDRNSYEIRTKFDRNSTEIRPHSTEVRSDFEGILNISMDFLSIPMGSLLVFLFFRATLVHGKYQVYDPSVKLVLLLLMCFILSVVELSGTIFVRWPQKLSGTVVGNYPAPGKRARFRFASGLLLACFRNASRMLQAADPKQILSRS